MLPAARLSRRGSVVPRRVEDVDDGTTETVVPNTAAGHTGTPTGGPPNTTAGAVTAVSDGSDTTYLAGVFDSSTGITSAAMVVVGFADLVLHDGRDIESFIVGMRARAGSVQVSGFAGTTHAVTPTSDTDTGSNSAIRDVVLGPFTRSGGGTWTVAQINALTCQFDASTSTGSPADMRLYQAYLTVTYATP